jgi:DNA-binding MarR family transcriptional regulator
MNPAKATTTPSEEAVSPMCINLQMLRASHYILKAYDEAYRPFGVRATQIPVLAVVARLQPASIQAIAREMESERSVISRKLQVMEKSGWVRVDPKNKGREKTFVLSPRGRELIEKVKPARLSVQQQLMSILNDDEQQLLLSLCSKLRDHSTQLEDNQR